MVGVRRQARLFFGEGLLDGATFNPTLTFAPVRNSCRRFASRGS